MDQIKHIDKSQHAYFVLGRYEEAEPLIRASIEKVFGVDLTGNPDYRNSYSESLGVDEARVLKENQGRKSFGGGFKFFVMGADSVTREAQNALLKVFEEPTEGTYLFLVSPSARQILPTLRSRVRVIKPTTHNPQPTTRTEAEEFLAATAERRLQLPFVKELIEDKDKQEVASFLEELQTATREKLNVSKIKAEEADFLRELIKLRGYAGDRSSSVKMLIEHISLVAPVIE